MLEAWVRGEFGEDRVHGMERVTVFTLHTPGMDMFGASMANVQRVADDIRLAYGSLIAIIIFLAMMTTTLQRTQVFGTLRAIGAQGNFVLNMVLLEAVLLGLVFAGVGLVAGTAIVGAISNKGIPAMNDYAYFFFSGPRLLPTLTSSNLVLAVVIVLVTTTIAAVIPAIMAMLVSPLRAMQSAED